MKKKSTLLLWMLAILFFAASVNYFIQGIRAVQSWNLLIILHYRFGPIYPVFQGIFLGSAFLVGGIFLIRRASWAPAFNGAVVLIASVWSWLDRTLLSLNPRPISQLIFAIVFTLLMLALILAGLWSLQPSMLSSNQETLEELPNSSSFGGKNER
jgi:hypothetical protein